MNGLLPVRDGVQTIEDGVDVARVLAEVEDRVERSRVEAPRDLRIAANELGEIELLFPGAHRMALHEPVGLVARQARLDEREQEPLAEVEAAARLEVAQHPLRTDDEPFDQPGE